MLKPFNTAASAASHNQYPVVSGPAVELFHRAGHPFFNTRTYKPVRAFEYTPDCHGGSRVFLYLMRMFCPFYPERCPDSVLSSDWMEVICLQPAQP
jgi:hypothetical protein